MTGRAGQKVLAAEPFEQVGNAHRAVDQPARGVPLHKLRLDSVALVGEQFADKLFAFITPDASKGATERSK